MLDEKGNMATVSSGITPKMCKEYYYINDGKISKKTADTERIEDTIFTTTSYFTSSMDNISKYSKALDDGLDFKQALKKAGIEEGKFEFNILSFEKEEIYVKLKDGRKGYIFYAQGYFVD